MPFFIIEPKNDANVPGTSLLDDEEKKLNFNELEDLHLKHGTGKYSHIVLVPQPTDDPNDPLVSLFIYCS